MGLANKPPNPGSREAIALGCQCPIMDNHHGYGVPLPNKKGEIEYCFWINGECELHNPKDKEGPDA